MTGERPPALGAYRGKRDPERTPEPFGGRRPGGGHLFVVQKHAARRLHYDLRLEMDGVLKSWAVPRGPSTRPEDKRLAVHVEDHPVEYAEFEGIIPAGNYGAGAVIVWDRGHYRLVGDRDPLAALARGRLDVEFSGFKMRGRWALARMSGKGRDWLLIRKAGGAGVPGDLTDRYPRSILSGLTVEEMRDAGARTAALRARVEALGAPRREVSAREQRFLLAALAEEPPAGADWLYEAKYDGVRVWAQRRGEGLELRGRSGQVVTGRYPEVETALRALPLDRFLLDGEIVALDDAGRPSFQRLQSRMGLTAARDVARAAAATPVVGVFFDCVSLDGRDLRRVPLEERKRCLEALLPPLGPAHYGDHVRGDGRAFLEAACAAGLEGIVAKRAPSAYVGGRSREWIKVKCVRRQEFVIGGYTDPQGERRHLGALHLGLYDGGRLVYVSKVGSGFDDAVLDRLHSLLAPLARADSPFATGAPTGRGHHWVEPRLVCEVRFTEWTRAGGLRHPTFAGLRDDRRPEECRREIPWRPGGDAVPDAPAPGADRAHDGAGDASPRKTRLTNLAKVFWPADGLTKGDLIAYYDAVAPLLLPYLRDRPLVLTRYPDGIGGKSFFQKDAPAFAPAWVRTERIYSKDADREIDYFVVGDAETLRYVINMGTIPLHLWSARLGSLDRPDWLVIDLDPKGAPFTDVVAVARALHRILDDLDLPSYVKTSGATGLHILLPLAARYSHEEARNFARLLALLAVDAVPEIATVARPLRARGGKVYVDFGQNGHGRTIVAPYSARPLPGAPASCPLRWSEVTPALDPGRFTIATIPRRFARMPDPLRPVLAGSLDMAAAIARVERRLGHAR